MPLSSFARAHERIMFTAAEFATAITSATDQLQLVQRELGTLTCPAVTALTINLQNLTQEAIAKLVHEVPSGYGKTDRETDYVSSSSCFLLMRGTSSIGFGNSLLKHACLPLTIAALIEKTQIRTLFTSSNRRSSRVD